MQTLYEKSRNIRRLIDEGKTTKQIKKIMQIKKSDLYQIVKSEYSERFSEILFKKLKQNDYFDKTKILVDTSALEVEGIVDYLWKYHKILLHIDVIREMDDHKFGKKKVFVVNIRDLLKRSAEDYDSLKVKIITSKRVSLYTDENIIHYLKKKVKKDRNIVLITDDNAFASLARGYGVKYILARSLERELTKTDVSESEKNTDKEVVNDNNNEKVNAKIKKDKGSSKSAINTQKRTSLQFVEFVGETLFLCPPIGKEASFIVLEGGEIKRSVTKDIPLRSGNKILYLFYTEKRKLKIQTFKITDIHRKKFAEDLGVEIFKSVEDIKELSYSDAVKSKIRYFFNLNKRL